jgi:hypothetical protein
VLTSRAEPWWAGRFSAVGGKLQAHDCGVRVGVDAGRGRKRLAAWSKERSFEETMLSVDRLARAWYTL